MYVRDTVFEIFYLRQAICLSRNLCIRYLKSGEFCDLSIISKWEKIELRLFFCTSAILGKFKHRDTGKMDTLNRKIASVTPSYVPEVISGHERSPSVFFINF